MIIPRYSVCSFLFPYLAQEKEWIVILEPLYFVFIYHKQYLCILEIARWKINTYTMINFNLYQYQREIEVVVLDSDNNTTMTQYLGNMPMYDTTHKLHKGIDNTLRFKFRDTDRKSIDLTGKTVIWKMYDRESRENVLFKYLTVTNATKGMGTLSIPTSDTILLPEGFYQFAMYTVEDGVEQILYTDDK